MHRMGTTFLALVATCALTSFASAGHADFGAASLVLNSADAGVQASTQLVGHGYRGGRSFYRTGYRGGFVPNYGGFGRGYGWGGGNWGGAGFGGVYNTYRPVYNSGFYRTYYGGGFGGYGGYGYGRPGCNRGISIRF